MENTVLHRPVMVREVLDILRLKNGYRVLDATVGCGGHAAFILERIQPEGTLVAVDRDENSLKIARQNICRFANICKLVHANFADIDLILKDAKIDNVDAALFDVGLSSYQIGEAARGFSFESEGPLDMRMDLSQALSAYDIVNRSGRDQLEDIIRDYGEERHAKRIARFITERRRNRPIRTTRELAQAIVDAVGRRYGSRRIHPATRTFQAMRIAVNRELESLDAALGKIADFLSPGARLCVISFHSLEDRIVKNRMKDFEKNGFGRVITKKPLRATREEMLENPRSRSAKLRAFERNG